MKFTSIFLIVIINNLPFCAQIYDVFQNKKYEISTYVLKDNKGTVTSNSNIEIHQDKNKNPLDQWVNIENQLYELALKRVNNEIEFFQIYSRAQRMFENFERREREEDEYYRSKNKKLTLEGVEIELLNVSDNFGTYKIVYDFGEIHVSDYYLTDYTINKCTPIGKTPTNAQVTALQEVSQTSFELLYLIHTRKLDIRNIERVKSVLSGQEKSNILARKLLYAEAIVFPYFNGIIIEFPQLSQSSELFDSEPFRILIKGPQLNKLLSVYGEFKPIFKRVLSPTSTQIQETLSTDAFFDLSKYRSAPRDLELLKLPNIIQEGFQVFSMTVSTFQIMDSVKSFRGSQKYFFNKTDQVIRKESRDDKKNVVEEKVYAYKNNQIEYQYNKRHETSLTLYHYFNTLLDFVEEIEVTDHRTHSSEVERETEIDQSHFVYSGNNRYTFNFNTIGKLVSHKYVQHRAYSDGKYCTNNCCLIVDDSHRVIAIQDFRNPMDIRVNDHNQPLEYYFDNDRYSYRFDYDPFKRISKFTESEFGKTIGTVRYTYTDNKSKPIIIHDSRRNTHLMFEIELEYWEK